MNCSNLMTKNASTMTTVIVDISVSPDTTAIKQCPDGQTGIFVCRIKPA